MELVAALRARFGRRLAGWLSAPDSATQGRLAGWLDDRFNLRYLADRILNERSAIDSYLQNSPIQKDQHGPLISIVAPVYGIKLQYVRAFIKSVQAQSWNEWELCLCIDGDPNASVTDYLRTLSERFPKRYRLITHKKNHGISAATKSALSLVQGEIVAFSDTDDLLHSEALRVMAHAFCRDDDIDVVYTNQDILTPWGYRIDPIYKPGWSPELLLSCNYINHLVAVRQTLMKKLEGAWTDRVNGCQDWDFLYRITPIAKRIHHIPIVLYHWRAREGSVATGAKLWAQEASRELQRDELQKRCPAAHWEMSKDNSLPVVKLNAEVAPNLFLLRIMCDASKTNSDLAKFNKPSFYGKTIMHEIIAQNFEFAAIAQQLDQAIKQNAPEHSVIHIEVLEQGRPDLKGDIDSLIGFSIMEGVGCVWPFFDQCRGCYTVSENGFVVKNRQAGFFSNWTGNVLTGPLHRATFSLNTWKKTGGFLSSAFATIDSEQPPDALGALFGLNALTCGLRNVSVHNATVDWQPPNLDLGMNNLPFDPYV